MIHYGKAPLHHHHELTFKCKWGNSVFKYWISEFPFKLWSK